MEQLDTLRKQIDGIDRDILELFERRMRLIQEVAAFKVQNNLPVLQSGREDEILSRMAGLSPTDMAMGTRLLFTSLMDISKCYQQERMTDCVPMRTSSPVAKPRVALQGIPGSYSQAACRKLFGDEASEVRFFERFEDVFETIRQGTADYAVIPIENSTAGEVHLTYELMALYQFFITKSISIPIRHVLAAPAGASLAGIRTVYSHGQALMQCSEYLRANAQITPVPYKNTAISAQKVQTEGNLSAAAICSAECAKLYGLEILKDNLSNVRDNFTRFIVIAPELQVEEGADIITLALCVPHTPGALYRMLTRFSFAGLNLLKLESRPVPPSLRNTANGALFYLDFSGNVQNLSVRKLLCNLERELGYYRFLGNYRLLLPEERE